MYNKLINFKKIVSIGFSLALSIGIPILMMGNIEWLLSAPSFGIMFGPLIFLWSTTYIKPLYPTAYDNIMLTKYRQILLMGGLLGTMYGDVLMAWGIIAVSYTHLTLPTKA